MDILAYEGLKEGMNSYNEKYGKPYGNAVVGKAPKTPTYPLTIFQEIRNVGTSFNTIADRVGSMGYSVKVEAKNKGKIENQTIAREIAQFINRYLEAFNLLRISYNENPSINDNSIYEVIMTYSGNLHENRRKFI
ncbi:MAG: hypothetical protein J6J71_04580 [Prevotella sp.]|nr:hypothetical protein [Prevotella sp.]